MNAKYFLIGIFVIVLAIAGLASAATNNFLDDVYSVINGVRLENGNVSATTGTFTNLAGTNLAGNVNAMSYTLYNGTINATSLNVEDAFIRYNHKIWFENGTSGNYCAYIELNTTNDFNFVNNCG